MSPPAGIALVSRPSDLRCAFCFDDLSPRDLPDPCVGCGTRVHVGCRRQLRHCPTLGCPIADEARRASRASERLSSFLSALILGGSFLWVAGLLLGTAYALWSGSDDQFAPELFLLVY